MKKFFSYTTLLLFLFLSTNISFAQDNRPGWLVTNTNKVSISDMDKLAHLDSIAIPILQSFVDNGMLFTFGRMDHAWGDEWNVNYYFVTKDAKSFFDFWEQYMEKLSEAMSDQSTSYRELFREHKDNMYAVRMMKFNREAALKELPLFLSMNQNKIAMTDFDKFDEIDRKTEPILNDLMSEGLLLGYGRLDHAWGDEWNLNYYMIAKDHVTYLKAWQEYLRRINEQFPEMSNQFLSMVNAHKDNMYFMRHVAKRKSE